jgi:hypothetical protein
LDAGGGNGLGRRVCRKARRQLELGPEGGGCLVSSHGRSLFAIRVGHDGELLKPAPP